MKQYYIFLSAVLSAIIVLVFLSTTYDGVRAGTGEVTFSHETHAEAAECVDCHAADESVSATDNLLPTPESCTDCHEEEEVRDYWELDATAALDKAYLTVTDRKLYFSHKDHLGFESLNCLSCHGSIVSDDDSAMPAMDDCYRCHNNAERIAPVVRGEDGFVRGIPATNQCEACHTTLAGLKPQNHMTSNFMQWHGKFAQNTEAETECAACHSEHFCQDCHTPTNDVPLGVTSNNFYIDAWPRNEKIDDGNMLTVQKSHSLTYRYTHGFDARAKSSRCETCHEPETFCTPCHMNGYDANGVRIVPQSHQMAGFVSLGGSKDFNRHGKMAIRDLESCATCHNMDGGDPSCVMCHPNGTAGGGAQ